MSIEKNIIFNTIKEPHLAPILPNGNHKKPIDEGKRQQELLPSKLALPTQVTQQEHISKGHIEEIEENSLPEPELVQLQARKRNKCLQFLLKISEGVNEFESYLNHQNRLDQ